MSQITRDALGDRMKERYEDRTRYYLPRRTYTIVRLDGVGFHNYTRAINADRPFDSRLASAMDETARTILKGAQGAKIAYVQSDEISVLLTDFEKPTTEAVFDNNLQKIVSVFASVASVVFNKLIHQSIRGTEGVYATFDARAFTIPDPVEVENYFIWRQKDAIRNSVSMLAQTLYSQQQLNGKSVEEQKQMIQLKGFDWKDHPIRFRQGSIAHKTRGDINRASKPTLASPAPNFVQEDNREVLRNLIPIIWAEDQKTNAR